MMDSYWQVGSDTTQFWSNRANGFVASSDSNYLAWRANNAVTIVSATNRAMRVAILQKGLLENSDLTMLRIQEAITLGLKSATDADVVAFVNWRRALRDIVGGQDTSSTSIPTRPAYPTGT